MPSQGGGDEKDVEQVQGTVDRQAGTLLWKSPPKRYFFFKNSTYTKIVIIYIYIYYIQYIIHQKHHTKIVVKLFSLNRFDHFGGDYFIDAYIYI